MAKSKNHTNHNQSAKAHRNGIRKPKRKRFESLLGMCQKYVTNMKYARKKNRKSPNRRPVEIKKTK